MKEMSTAFTLAPYPLADSIAVVATRSRLEDPSRRPPASSPSRHLPASCPHRILAAWSAFVK